VDEINIFPITILPEQQQAKARETLDVLPGDNNVVQSIITPILKNGIGIHAGILNSMWSVHNLRKIESNIPNKKVD